MKIYLWIILIISFDIKSDISLKELNLIADNLLGTTSKEALDNKFIDKIIHEDDYRKSLLEILDSDDLNLIDFKTMNSKIKDYDLKIKDKIAMIYAQGTILYVEGNETIIGENGVRLSGGEKQRLSIARAILKKSPIILLDEATSSLDAETEDKIQKAISFLTKGRTTIVIAHRLSTIHSANKIFVMKQGKVINSGDHNFLINNCEEYKSLYKKHGRL